MKKILFLTSILIFLTACEKNKIKHDEAYYEANPTERNAKVKECNAKHDGGMTDSECIAAITIVKKHISTGTPVYVNDYKFPEFKKK